MTGVFPFSRCSELAGALLCVNWCPVNCSCLDLILFADMTFPFKRPQIDHMFVDWKTLLYKEKWALPYWEGRCCIFVCSTLGTSWFYVAVLNITCDITQLRTVTAHKKDLWSQGKNRLEALWVVTVAYLHLLLLFITFDEVKCSKNKQLNSNFWSISCAQKM